ncbi:MAG: hypothetical protein JNJ77_08705 [Planctomycetia bacterium]|nr:hypothetical protein [Planctomycetia bacterium]
MALDKSGKWWKGSTAADALEYLNELEPGGYSVDEVLPQSCACGCVTFQVFRNDNELSYLVCSECRTKSFVTDSEQHDEGETYELIKCSCKNKRMRVFLGVHSISDKEVANWMSICTICDKCKVIGSPLDWEFDTEKSDETYAKHTRPLNPQS